MIKTYWNQYKPLLLGILGLSIATGFIYMSLVLLNQAELRSDSQFGGKISRLKITGNLQHVSLSTVKKVLMPVTNTLVMDLDLPSIQADLEVLPWVRKVSVARVFPDILKVHVQEQQAVARWQKNAYLNPWGERFSVSEFSGSKGLVHLKGSKGMEKSVLKQYVEVKSQLGAMAAGLVSLVQGEKGGLVLHFSDGLKVILGRHHMLKRLARLNRILAVYKQYPNRIHNIDLRYRKGFAIKMKQKVRTENV